MTLKIHACASSKLCSEAEPAGRSISSMKPLSRDRSRTTLTNDDMLPPKLFSRTFFMWRSVYLHGTVFFFLSFARGQ